MFEKQAIFPSAELYLIKKFMLKEGVKPSQWLLGTGLSEERLQQEDYLISLQQFDIIYRNVYRLAKGPDHGLRFGHSLNLSRWGLLTTALTASKTLGAALEVANHHRLLIRSRFNLQPEIIGSDVKINISLRENMNLPVSQVFALEMLISSLQRQVEDLLGRPCFFRRIQLAYPAPHYEKAYQRYCQCPIDFNTQHHVIWISQKDMSQSLPLANPVTQKQSIAICQTEMARLDSIQKGDIQWLLRHEFQQNGHIPETLNSIAKNMAISPRTLRRKLHAAGTSYSVVLQEYQLQKALGALSLEHLSMDEVSRSCGFGDVASFRQAFKRWTDMTPLSYRKQFQETKYVDPNKELSISTQVKN